MSSAQGFRVMLTGTAPGKDWVTERNLLQSAIESAMIRLQADGIYLKSQLIGIVPLEATTTALAVQAMASGEVGGESPGASPSDSPLASSPSGAPESSA